jgi:hypothetical protein
MIDWTLLQARRVNDKFNMFEALKKIQHKKYFLLYEVKKAAPLDKDY